MQVGSLLPHHRKPVAAVAAGGMDCEVAVPLQANNLPVPRRLAGRAGKLLQENILLLLLLLLLLLRRVVVAAVVSGTGFEAGAFQEDLPLRHVGCRSAEQVAVGGWWLAPG